uniref:JAZF zinc finger 1a n=1 Tax=Oncorhynchus tshawytscha TaxID=74940 RepID=A0AAZ3Q1W4_ONCTS
MTGIAAASFFSNSCRFGGCGLQFESLAELIVHIEDNHIDTDPRVLEKQEQQQPTYLALSYINRFMTDAARREQETLKKKATPKLSLSITGGVSRNSVATPPRHSNGNLTPPITPPRSALQCFVIIVLLQGDTLLRSRVNGLGQPVHGTRLSCLVCRLASQLIALSVAC